MTVEVYYYDSPATEDLLLSGATLEIYMNAPAGINKLADKIVTLAAESFEIEIGVNDKLLSVDIIHVSGTPTYRIGLAEHGDNIQPDTELAPYSVHSYNIDEGVVSDLNPKTVYIECSGGVVKLVYLYATNFYA